MHVSENWTGGRGGGERKKIFSFTAVDDVFCLNVCCAPLNTGARTRMYVCVRACVRVCVCVRACVRTCVRASVGVCVGGCLCVCVCVCV